MVAIAAAAALIAGIVVWTTSDDGGPAPPAPAVSVARPTGLRVIQHTAGSIELRWRAGKPAVDAYVILRDGAEVGRVPGSAGEFSDVGLLPATTYSYQVMAELSDGLSAPSRAATATTDRASLSSALLDGTWKVQMRITSAFGFNEITEGRGDSASWTFDPRAGGIRVTGSPFKYGFFGAMLQRDGAMLTGDTREQLSTCSTTRVTDTLTFRIRITTGAVRDGAWRATAWTGTLEDASPPASSGSFSCGSSGYTAALVARPA